MRLSARDQKKASWPPIRRRQRRSISVIPNSRQLMGVDEIFFAKPQHKRSHSMAAGTVGNTGEWMDASLRFIFDPFTCQMDALLGSASSEQKNLRSDRSFDDDFSTGSDTSRTLSSMIDDEENGDGGYCPVTPTSQLSYRMTSWSPPALCKPSYYYLDVSPTIDSALCLPDCF